MNEFEKQVEEQIKLHRLYLEEDIKRLTSLTKRLGIDSQSMLEAVLEFTHLYERLCHDGVITGFKDRY